MLVVVTVLSSLAIAMMSIHHQASAKVCIGDSSTHNDKNNNNYADTHITTCTHEQDSNSHDHSTTKDTTPFLLAIPFP
jgi:cytochrome c553